MIYFIACPKANAVKIGTTKQTWHTTPYSAAFARLGQAQVNCPLELELRAVCEGGREEEAALHHHFAALRIRGEWFALSGGLEVFIAGLPKVPKLGRGWHFQRDTHPAMHDLPSLPPFNTRPSPENPRAWAGGLPNGSPANLLARTP